MLKKKLERKNKEKTLKNQFCSGGTAAAHFTASRLFIQGSNGAIIMCGAVEKRACNSWQKLVTWSSLMSNNLVLRGRKETACNPWDCWACCWPAGLAVGLLALWLCCSFSFFNTSLHLKYNIKFIHYKCQACCWPCGLAAGLLALWLCCSFSFFSTSLYLKHNIKFRHYKIKIMHVNKLFLYNIMK